MHSGRTSKVGQIYMRVARRDREFTGLLVSSALLRLASLAKLRTFWKSRQMSGASHGLWKI